MKKKLISIFTALMLFIMQVQTAFASNAILESQPGKGFLKFLSDAKYALLLIVPSIIVICIIVFAVRKGMADETDQRAWQKRINTALFVIVISLCASAIVALIQSYLSGASA